MPGASLLTLTGDRPELLGRFNLKKSLKKVWKVGRWLNPYTATGTAAYLLIQKKRAANLKKMREREAARKRAAAEGARQASLKEKVVDLKATSQEASEPVEQEEQTSEEMAPDEETQAPADELPEDEQNAEETTVSQEEMSGYSMTNDDYLLGRSRETGYPALLGASAVPAPAPASGIVPFIKNNPVIVAAVVVAAFLVLSKGKRGKR
jgi:hypothetical protein